MLNKGLYTSTKDDWGTPRYLFDQLDNEFGFTLDACATSKNAKCRRYLTVNDNALMVRWQGIVWMNPPYGRQIVDWVRKAHKSSRHGCICVCLVPVRSDTRWWHRYVMRSYEIRFLTKRLTFEGANNKAPFPACIVVFRPGNHKPRLGVTEV